MKVYWGPTSPFVRKVMIFAYETGLETLIERVRRPVGMLRPNREVLQVNPLGKIPVLVTETGLVLFESDVICEYLDTLHHRTRLIPVAGTERWEALRWNAVASGALEILVLWRNELLRAQDMQSEELVVTFALKIQTALDWVENAMPALARTSFGIGHVTLGCLFGYLDFRFPKLSWRKEHPQSAVWYDEFSTRISACMTEPRSDPTQITGVTI